MDIEPSIVHNNSIELKYSKLVHQQKDDQQDLILKGMRLLRLNH